jgi:CheY-like chemotaxis protein
MTGSSAAPRRVLVVEDDGDILDSLIELLQDSGYDAVGAVDGRDALDKLHTLDPRPSVIVLDLMMPVMDGRAFREAQMRDPELSDIPVIVVSAFHDVPYDSRELAASSYLKKPLKLKDLLQLVARHCHAGAA